MTLELLDLNEKETLDWVWKFINEYHNISEELIPSKEELILSGAKFYSASINKENYEYVIGISSYIKITNHLAKQQYTIIHPDCQGWGYGLDLADAMIKELIKLDFGKVCSSVYTDNERMLKIKITQGFLIEGCHPDHDGSGLDEYSLGLMLK